MFFLDASPIGDHVVMWYLVPTRFYTWYLPRQCWILHGTGYDLDLADLEIAAGLRTMSGQNVSKIVCLRTQCLDEKCCSARHLYTDNHI